jgi:hypothetical protein
MYENDRPKQHPRGRLGNMCIWRSTTFPVSPTRRSHPTKSAAPDCISCSTPCASFEASASGLSRVMTDNGSGFRSRRYAQAVRRLKIKHLRTKPYTLKTNGKADKFVQTSLRRWAYARAYARAYSPSEERAPNCPSGSPATTAVALMAVLTQSLRSPDSPYGSIASQRFVWSACGCAGSDRFSVDIAGRR